MSLSQYIYSFKHDSHYTHLYHLESRQIFGEEPKGKYLFSTKKVDPSISPFIKSRFDILFSTEDYAELLEKVKGENIHFEGFKAEYLVLKGDTTGYRERLNKLKDIGYRIEGEPDYYAPTIIYSICYHQKLWYFGILRKHNTDWHQHKQKPCSFSNSINMNIAKVLVSIASQGDTSRKLLDACCGVGTIVLEACIAGINIEGCDINESACTHTRQNIAHYGYTANIHCLDIKNLHQRYDAAIIDLPYNLYSYSDESITANIITSTAKLASRVIIVSIENVEQQIIASGLNIIESSFVEKRGTSKFTRNIWVCER